MVSKIALDTNVMIYALDAGSPFYKDVRLLIKHCIDRKFGMCIAMQAIPESVNALVRDRKVEAKRATAMVENLLDMLDFEILYPRTGSISLFYEYSNHLKMNHRTYDIFMSAVLVDRGVDTLCTYNTKDFQDIPYITAARPEELLKQHLI